MLNKARKTQVIELLQELIRRPSLSGYETDVAHFIKESMLSMGYDDVYVDQYGNVIGHIAFEPGGPRLLIDAHMDHVGIGNPRSWEHYPYGAQIEDNKIYGRGSTDAKGSLSSAMAAASYLKEDHSLNLHGDLYVAATVYQESFEGIASALVAERTKPDMVVVTDATELDLKYGQRGRAEIVLEVQGKRAHSSLPEQGTNAVWNMSNLLSAIRNSYVPPEHPVLGKGVLEVTDIISSPFPSMNVVPDGCKATFDRRLLIDELPSNVLMEIQSFIDQENVANPSLKASVRFVSGEIHCYTGATFNVERFAPAWLMDKEHPFVTSALRGLREVGINPSLSTYGYCTNGSYYAGKAGIPTIGFAPSREDLVHSVDEYVEIDQLIDSCKGYYGIAKSVLGKEPER